MVSPFWPGSHCSPASTIPSAGQQCSGGTRVDSLPHCCRLIVDLSPGFWTQLDETSRAPRPLHTFPRVHCENVSSVSDVVGFMIYRPPASQVLALRGQQPPDSEHPEVQSWIAPKLESEMSPNRPHDSPMTNLVSYQRPLRPCRSGDSSSRDV